MNDMRSRSVLLTDVDRMHGQNRNHRSRQIALVASLVSLVSLVSLGCVWYSFYVSSNDTGEPAAAAVTIRDGVEGTPTTIITDTQKAVREQVVEGVGTSASLRRPVEPIPTAAPSTPEPSESFLAEKAAKEDLTKQLLLESELELLSDEAAIKANRELRRGNPEISIWNPNKMVADKRLKCVVAIPDGGVKVGETIRLDITWENISSQDLSVVTAPVIASPNIPGYQARICDSDGNLYWGSISPIAFYGAGFSPRIDDYELIPVGGSKHRQVEIAAISGAVLDGSVSDTAFPGEFLLTVIYGTSLDSYTDRLGTHKLENAWTGRLLSNTVAFTVE